MFQFLELPPKRAKVAASKRLFDVALSPITDAKKSSTTILTPTHQRIGREHSYNTTTVDMKREFQILKAQLFKARTDIVSLKKKLKRRELKMSTIEEKLAAMHLSTDHLTSLQQQFPGLLGTLIQNQSMASRVRGKNGMKYNDQMRKFAVTLHFYSPRAYLFLRKHLALPHPNTLGTWMDGSDCGPGFNLRVLGRISSARDQAKDPTALIDVALMIDEIATKKELVWDPSLHHFVGSVDFGTGEADGERGL